MNSGNGGSALLRRALKANGAFSALSGLILLVAARPLAALFGLHATGSLIGVGASLLVYATVLFRNALRAAVDPREASLAVILDLAWVAGSAVLIFAGVLSAAGNWTVAVLAEIVLCFAVLQFFGIRQMRAGRT
jgi:hypothetical protein